VLASFGIETAADIEQYKIAAIQGFGPTLVASLMEWRQNLTKRFVFNASEPINPNDLVALRSRISNQKIELDKKIRASVANLQQASNLCLSQRAKLASSANQAVAARKQAELNEQAATGPLYKSSKIISLCCAVLAALGLMIGRDAIERAIRGNASVSMTGAERPIATSRNFAQSDTQQRPSALKTPPVEVSDQKSPIGSQLARQDEAITPPIPLAPPIPLENPEISAKNRDAPSNGATVRNLSERDDAIQVQRRLAELGYLSGSADGKWGPRSKRALLEYKEKSGLDGNDLWDEATERSLFSDSATHGFSALPFVGGWTFRSGECGEPGQPPPVRITAKRAETSGGPCEFNSIRSDGSGAWLIDAKCSATESSHVAHIRLAVDGDVLHWTSEQPEVLYYRCSR
jgi:hypothetical protein